MLSAALDYAARGWPVFPVHYVRDGACSCGQECGSPAKHPMTMNGLKNATTDADKIRRWWEKRPDSNIGLVTGVAFDVFDIDDAGGLTAEQLRAIGAMDGPGVITGGAGMHCYVLPTGLGNRAKFLPGCDWRGAGGYVLAPPSTHLSGHRYEWLDPLFDQRAEIKPCPGWLMEALTPPKPVRTEVAFRVGTNPIPYGEAALKSEVSAVLNAAEGVRNVTLNNAAMKLGTLVGGGVLDAALVASSLLSAGLQIGLGQKECEATIRSGMTAGIQQPRTPL